MTAVDINPFPLGAIAPTSGTPVSILNNFTDLAQKSAKMVLIYAPSTNTGKVYVGRGTMNRGTFAGVLAVLDAGQTKALPFNDMASNVLDMTKFFVDVDTTGDQGVVTALFA